MKTKNKSALANIAMLFTAMIWGGGFVAVKGLLGGITPLWMMAIRFSIAAVLAMLLFFKRLKNITKELLVSGASAGFFLFAGNVAQTIGLKYTTVGKGAFITTTYVAMTPLLYWFISKKRPSAMQIGAAFLCVGGIALLNLDGDSAGINIGDAVTVICAFFFALHIIALSRGSKKHDPFLLNTVQLFFTALFSLLAALMFEETPKSLGSDILYAMAYLSVLSSFLAFLIQTTAQKYTSPSHASLILSTECLFGTLFAVIILGEVLSTKMLVGGILIFTAIVLSEIASKEKVKKIALQG